MPREPFQVKNLSSGFLHKHRGTATSTSEEMQRKPRKDGSHWFHRGHRDKNNNNHYERDQEVHSNSRARTKRREYRPGDGLNMNRESTNQRPQFEDKPHHKQKQSNHEQVAQST